MSHTLTIPKSFVKNDDLVVMPRHEYERLISVQKFKEFTPTAADKKALARARKNLKAGHYTVWAR